MHIQINTDSNIEGDKKFSDEAKMIIEDSLARFKNDITRIEVHLRDENGQKDGANDKRCMIEARLKGRQPISETHSASTVDEALSNAADKLKISIERDLGRLKKFR